MTGRTPVKVIVVVTILVFSGGIFFDGGTLEWRWLRFAAAAVFAGTACLQLWNTWLWRTPLAQAFDSVPRNLRGTWKGTLESDWVNPETNERIEAREAFLVIQQSASTVSVVLHTDRQRSSSRVGDVETGTSPVLHYSYISNPEDQAANPIHYGTAALSVSGQPATRLTGTYWTSRKTLGRLDLYRRSKEFADDYEHARQLYQAD